MLTLTLHGPRVEGKELISETCCRNLPYDGAAGHSKAGGSTSLRMESWVPVPEAKMTTGILKSTSHDCILPHGLLQHFSCGESQE